MNGFNPPDDDDCGCQGYGHSCEYHAQAQKESAAYAAQWMRSEGWDPTASVEGLEDVLFAVELSTALSDDQKRRIRQIIFGR
jgi:hypothetical protein